MKIKLSPSLLSADLANIEKAVRFAESKSVAALHVDVMDGHFVPEVTYGEAVIRAIKKLTSLPLDVHLMTTNAEERAPSYIAAGASWLTFHTEATIHQNRLAAFIKSSGCLAGISLNPSTPVATIEEMLPFVDLVLVMSVNPGFGGQSFIAPSLKKIEKLKALRTERALAFKISVDGGINKQTLLQAESAGADLAVSGSAFFSGALEGVI